MDSNKKSKPPKKEISAVHCLHSNIRIAIFSPGNRSHKFHQRSNAKSYRAARLSGKSSNISAVQSTPSSLHGEDCWPSRWENISTTNINASLDDDFVRCTVPNGPINLHMERPRAHATSGKNRSMNAFCSSVWGLIRASRA